VAALARALGRPYRRVHDDVEALIAVGLMERNDDVLIAQYERIKTEIVM
jgi:predicted transcriptional regulator